MVPMVNDYATTQGDGIGARIKQLKKNEWPFVLARGPRDRYRCL